MNGRFDENQRIIRSLLNSLTLSPEQINKRLYCGICPPSIYIHQVSQLLKHTPIFLGAQDASAQEQGAYTGDIAASMLVDYGCQYVIVGHSERRQYHGESDLDIANKAQQVIKQGMKAVVCVGETLEQRNAGQHQAVVRSQLQSILPVIDMSQCVLAYEPIWAIGTGKTASEEQAQSMHQWMRQVIAQYDIELSQQITIIYGGSVNENNAKALKSQQDIDGFLVGGASLKPQSFIKICEVF